jgi:hypothetical protein
VFIISFLEDKRRCMILLVHQLKLNLSAAIITSLMHVMRHDDHDKSFQTIQKT